MLARTLSTDFSTGLNLKHDLAGGTWTYLLPRLELSHVVCIGAASPASLVTLSRISDQVTVICDASESCAELQQQVAGAFPNVTIVDSIAGLMAMTPPRADLVYLTGMHSLRQLHEDPDFQTHLSQLMKESGLIYFELSPVHAWLNGSLIKELEQRYGPTKRFWLTPWYGEMKTAVPVRDRQMAGYFLQNTLYSPSFNLSVLKHKLVGRRRFGGARANGRQQPAKKKKTLQRRLRTRVRPLLRSVSVQFVRALVKLERFLLNRGRLFRRQGLLLHAGPGAGTMQIDSPPAYLRAIASSNGVDIDGYRWGFSGRGRYSSRKLLFFLHNQDKTGDSDGNYIVKMVREPAYNARLENEYRALVALESEGYMDAGAYPRPIFFGHHNGLAIAGESHVDGEPFRARTQATADCPYARAAIDALIRLGAASACSAKTPPKQIAAALKQLLDTFVDIYCPSEDVQAFLDAQVSKIARFDGDIPLVFQHGDPGTWNLFVTGRGRVAFLDWEAAEIQGMPLWDLFYFLRSYSTWVGKSNGGRNALRAIQEGILGDGPLAGLMLDASFRYCREVDLPIELVEPFFYTCWMHRALKQATSLTPDRLAGGHYYNLLRLTIDERPTSPVLKTLFSDLSATNHQNVQ